MLLGAIVSFAMILTFIWQKLIMQMGWQDSIHRALVMSWVLSIVTIIIAVIASKFGFTLEHHWLF